MPVLQAVTLDSSHYGPIQLASHDFDSALTRLVASRWERGALPAFARAVQAHVASQLRCGLGRCHNVADALVADCGLTRYTSYRRDRPHHSWVELGDEALDVIFTTDDRPVINVMGRDDFRRAHRMIRPRLRLSLA